MAIKKLYTSLFTGIVTRDNLKRSSWSIKVVFLLALIVTSGCKKLVEIDPPKTEVLTSSVFTTDGSASAALTGMYSSLLTGQSFKNVGYLSSLSADETDPTYTTYLYTQFGSNTLSADDGTVEGIWSGFYNTVYQANSIIGNVQASKGMSDSMKTRYMAEAKFVRGISNFYMVGFFGPIPIITATDVKTNAAISRSDTMKVYQQIIKDLTDAESNLPSDYQSYNNRRDRPNKYAAASLLSKAYLAIGDNVNAEQHASLVVNNVSLYQLLPSSQIGNTFLKDSPETIWAINPETTSGQIFTNDIGNYIYSAQYGALYGPQYVLTSTLSNAFEAGDLRKTTWINSFVYQGATYYYGAKYKNFSFGSKPLEYDVVLRLSEQYLIRAEARAKQGNINGAQSDLNVIRNRAGLGNTAAATPSSLLSAIMQERRVELFLEFGNRWFDLKRTGQANAVLGGLKPLTWKPTAVLYPVPLQEIKSAPQLTQNPGY